MKCDLTVVRQVEEFTDDLNKIILSDFLHRVMHPYEDKREDILRGIDYALGLNPGGFIVLAHIEGRLAGASVVLCTGMSGYIPPNLLLFIGVEPEIRGHGIGRKIIETITENTKGDIKLHVEEANPARHLYERCGFQKKYFEMRLKNE
ncbi:GNAT family N-acetyltransferase [Myxococcota bacterium]|nr:GNAT family N-acetyltransferase [Myxococcota bacterium]MBU1379471.1 GNAT family N-acetyltransferase [Myxococcota bacterium]MBU1496174.1 GNAT family N-acetyltransferase [Myxococcota bacterium]